MSTTPPPPWLKNPIALDEWARVCSKYFTETEVPDEILGPLAIYCAMHATLAEALTGTDPLLAVKASPLVGQYRTLAAALFGRGSTRHQPGKNPFAQLRERKPRAAPIRVTAQEARADVVKLVEFFRDEGARFGDYGDDRGWTPGQTAVHFLRDLKHHELTGCLTNYAAPATPALKPRAKSKGRNLRK